MIKLIYADNAATTKISKKALEAMLPFLKENFGNASSLYKKGRETKKALEETREKIAKCLGAFSSEIFFTSGGSEANNWAIKGICEKKIKEGKNHIITSSFEHHAVLHTIKSLEKKGFEVTYIKVNKDGIINPEDVKEAITEKTAIVSIMYANNEIGTIQPIDEISEICKDKKIIFHTDAISAISEVRFDLKNQNIDLLSISAHKIYGPKGIGCLYIKKGTNISNLIEGGAQERGKRAGTENIAGIIGFGAALEEIIKNIKIRCEKLTKLRDKFIKGALKIEQSILNGHKTKRLSSNVNMCFHAIEGESLLLKLDSVGICASSGSACTSGSLDPSHVLLAIGLPHEIAHGSLRLTFSEENTEEDIYYILKHLKRIVSELRDMSPIWNKNAVTILEH